MPKQNATPKSIPASKVPFYRSYGWFILIFIFLPVIIGLLILLTGDVYRVEAKKGKATPISQREAIFLTIVAVVLQALEIIASRK